MSTEPITDINSVKKAELQNGRFSQEFSVHFIAYIIQDLHICEESSADGPLNGIYTHACTHASAYEQVKMKW